MSENFYENKKVIAERVKLAEDILLPESYDDYKNISAKFYFYIYTPKLDLSKINETSKPAPNVSKFNNNNLRPDTYNEVNYITLTIPRYILFQFKNKVPAGTEFIITNIGHFRIENFRIIGIYTLEDEVNDNESEETTS